MRNSMGEFVAELWRYLKIRKRFWLVPIIVVLLGFSILLALATSSPVLAPFLYPLF